MTWVAILEAVKAVLSMLPAEFDVSEVEKIAWAVFEAGWTKGSFLKAIISDADKVFPDSRTRPIAVFFLTAMLSLLGTDQGGLMPPVNEIKV